MTAAPRVPHCPRCGSPLYDGSSCPDCGHAPAGGASADRRMFRYVVSVDDEPHVVPLSHSPVAVAAIGPDAVEFWAEHTEGAPQVKRAFRVFGTGHPLPEGARWVGTCPRLPSGLVWHLYEIPAGGL